MNGFTEEHGKLLRDERVKTVAVGFDSDEAGRAASASLAERLVTDGFTVKILTPPTGKDWNEALVAGLKKDAVHQLLAAAEVRKHDARGGRASSR